MPHESQFEKVFQILGNQLDKLYLCSFPVNIITLSIVINVNIFNNLYLPLCGSDNNIVVKWHLKSNP
jgi:hypothetical protein